MSDHEFDLDDADHAEVRDLLANLPLVEPPPGAMERIIAAVAADTGPVGEVADLGERRRVRSQRWIPRVAAAAVVLAIVGVVVGGVGADTRIPAVGDLVAAHEAAAAEVMPDSAHEMPMDEAHHMGPAMPESMEMMAAYVESGGTIHLVYSAGGGVVSVFRQEGDTDLGELDRSGEVKMMGETPMWSAVVAEMHVAVLDGDGYVWTVVADHHDDEMMDVMTDDLPSRSPSLLERARDVADAVVEPWRFGA